MNAKTEKDYYVFAVKRNPMDIVISIYEKMKNDSKGNFTNLNLLEKNGGHISKRQRKHYLFIRKNNATVNSKLTVSTIALAVVSDTEPCDPENVVQLSPAKLYPSKPL